MRSARSCHSWPMPPKILPSARSDGKTISLIVQREGHQWPERIELPADYAFDLGLCLLTLCRELRDK
jgi:hypothetical protein